MTAMMPQYLSVKAEDLGKGTTVNVRVVDGGVPEIGADLAQVMFEEIEAAGKRAKPATFIVPVGPVDQYPILAGMINQRRLDCRDVSLINMDEYLMDDDQWIPLDHPLSFIGHMNRLFYDRLDPELAPRRENRLFPHPQRCEEIQRTIDRRGGVDVCFGGIGINGHIAFNEPPRDGEEISNERFTKLPTRCLSLTPETRTINANTVGGEISIIPRRAVTVGMKECLGARRMRFYCNRPWQSAVVRRVLHGPITVQCPASFLRTHPDASITVAQYVANIPEIGLR